MDTQKRAGRPLKYKSVKALEAKIEAYFEQCAGEIMTDEETGKPIVYKGMPVYKNRRPPTVTGLALALGFATRSSLMDYQGKPQFEAAIQRAKSRIEQYTEERLFDRDGSAGARFSLQNNFRNWKTEAEINITPAEGEVVLSEIRQRMREQAADTLSGASHQLSQRALSVTAAPCQLSQRESQEGSRDNLASHSGGGAPGRGGEG